jgi:hypothetical protein
MTRSSRTTSSFVPLEVPPEVLDRVAAAVAQATARVASSLERFEGLHILVLETPDALGELLPGEVPAALPAFVGHGVAVAHPASARAVLEAGGVPWREAPGGGCFVPASSALGAAVVFRPSQP